MAITPAEIETLEMLYKRLQGRWASDEVYYQYVMLKRRIEQLGMAVPPEMRRFLVMLGWPNVVIDTITSRQQVRALTLPGEERADELQLRIWEANNLSAHTDMFRRDALTYGRAFMSVGSNEAGPLPLVRVESPREIEADVDIRRESMRAAARFYGWRTEAGGLAGRPTHATLYMPTYTKWLARDDNGRWVESDVDHHELGSVPLVMHLNRRWSGMFDGESELTSIIPLTDSAVRSLTNMQFAQEAHGVPSIWATGVTRGDFVDDKGAPLSQFEAYYDVVKMLTNADGKFGQFAAADLKNFETALRVYGTQASIATGFPARYFGNTTTNPASEGAVIADEIQLVRSVEKKNDAEGVSLGWVAGLAHRFATGEWVEGNRIRVEYHNPATPTVAQREDALYKRRAAGVLSREGYWDELGWSEARKAKEREYLAAEVAEGDAYLAMLAAKSASAASAVDSVEV